MRQGSRANRSPLKAQRAPGGKKFRCVGRACPAAPAAQHVLAHHELSVVLTDGARSGAEAGVGRIGARGPLPGVTEEAVGRDGRAWMGRTGRQDVFAKKVVAFTVG